ncbi:hypothetical protein F5880DRAFT_1613566 [Lentinula raphanica]|nr:hypothetical protein F5880DRAFT_1613566 [Lentinula raphanica]
MQVHFWARNLSPGASVEITPTRPLHLTNISISFDFRDAFAPTSLLLSVALADRRTSPRYTVATLVAGQGIKYVFSVNGPNALSLLGYYTQTFDIGQSAPLPSQNFTFQVDPGSTNQNGHRVSSKIAPVPNVITNPQVASGPNGLAWGVGPISGRTVSSSTGNDQPPSVANNPPHRAPPVLPSQFAAADNGNSPHGTGSGANQASSRAIKPLRHRQVNPPPGFTNPSSNSTLTNSNC